MFFEEGNALNMFFRPQGYRKCVKIFGEQHCLYTESFVDLQEHSTGKFSVWISDCVRYDLSAVA